jgi:hypothetical protein
VNVHPTTVSVESSPEQINELQISSNTEFVIAIVPSTPRPILSFVPLPPTKVKEESLTVRIGDLNSKRNSEPTWAFAHDTEMFFTAPTFTFASRCMSGLLSALGVFQKITESLIPV